jgi:hypothetical protein
VQWERSRAAHGCAAWRGVARVICLRSLSQGGLVADRVMEDVGCGGTAYNCLASLGGCCVEGIVDIPRKAIPCVDVSNKSPVRSVERTSSEEDVET